VLLYRDASAILLTLHRTAIVLLDNSQSTKKGCRCCITAMARSNRLI
jgi:hypothetical protein